MIKLENVETFGWEAAIRGMRNPMNSWNKSDSFFGCGEHSIYPYCHESCYDGCEWVIGKNDLKLMKNLSKAGNDHSKFLRMINVTCDITAPLYWWKEFDTYKVGTVANSCSTMHKIQDKEFTLDDFSHEHLSDNSESDCNIEVLTSVVCALNHAREHYLTSKNKHYWWQMIQLLPSSYNQKRTVQLNYQVLKHMYKSRWNHKLDEWVYFCKWMHDLPYFKEVCLNVD